MKVFTQIKKAKILEKGVGIYAEIDKYIYPSLLRYKGDKDYIDAEIDIKDPRVISTEQRKKIYATLKDISDFTGYLPEQAKGIMKYDYIANTGDDYFSLSNCSKSTAREFINHLVEFCIKWNVPTSESLLKRTDDINKYLYFCLKNRVCAISNEPNADIHHCKGSHVGMGRNRHKINHSKLELIALSRYWHTRVHNEGESDIFEEYKVYGITVDDVTLKILGLNVNDIN